MSASRSPEDVDLLERLGGVLDGVDPPPPDVRRAALACFAFRRGGDDMDRELAALLYDSTLAPEPAGVRAGATGAAQRSLTFQVGDRVIEVELLSQGRLVGQLVPPEPEEVEVVTPKGSTTVTADHLGRFVAEGVRPGPLRLRCGAGATAVVTEWVIV
jgi:hypothetical protein